MTEPERPPTEKLEQLRAAFPAGAVGKLPRVTCNQCRDARDKVCDKHSKSKCAECGNYISGAHMHLDYVGHAEVTDRLLSVDPLWSWEPMAYDNDGTPLIKKGASGEWELWIWLTVCGVRRPGVGSVSTGFDAGKQLIGDALRNAAMRFGVALDLWSKAELESALDDTPIRGPQPDRTPSQLLADRIATLDAEARVRLGAFCDLRHIPRVPREMDDDQREAVNLYLDAPPDASLTPAETPVQPSESEPAPVIGEDRSRQAERFVANLETIDVLASLNDYGIVPARSKPEQRVQLAAAIEADDAWTPVTA